MAGCPAPFHGANMSDNNNNAVPADPAAVEVSPLVARAQSRGSLATTPGGAKRYLLNNLPEPLPGLVHLRTPACWGVTTQAAGAASAAIDRDTHRARVERLARRLAAANPGYPAWGEYATRAGHPLTQDALDRLDAKTLDVWRRSVLKELRSDWPYRRASSRWAGGDHYIELQIGDAPQASGWSQRVWSSNGKWSGNDSNASLTITARCLRALEGRVLLGGLLTVDCEPVAPREYRAVWVEQGPGFGLKLVHGWIIRRQHVRATTLERARKKAKGEREAQARHLWEQRQRVVELGDDLATIEVTRADSLAAGNCKAGTDNFVRSRLDFLRGAPSIRADHLLAIENSVYTRRAIAAARRRIAQSAAKTNQSAVASPAVMETEAAV